MRKLDAIMRGAERTTIVKTAEQIEKMEVAGRLLARCHEELKQRIQPGVQPLALDRFVEEFLESHGATPEQKGYEGYPFATCASVNDVICHGMPGRRGLRDGDIVTIDMVVNVDGWLADSAWSYPVGQVSSKAKKLLKVTREALRRGIAAAQAGSRVGDIGHAIQTYVEPTGFSIVRQFVGHGIGRHMHEGPEIPHVGRAGTGPLLREGLVITIEPMINVGTWEATVDLDGWTARTADGSLSCQFEHTIAITKDGPRVLTAQQEDVASV